MTTLTPLQQRRETVLDLYAKGRTPASIGAEIDTPAKVVREILTHARKSGDARAAHNRPEPFAWTDEKLATALRMAAIGHTAQDIVDEIGGTRNVVIGKLYRMGRPLGRKASPPVAPKAARAPVERKGPAKRPPVKAAEKPVKPAKPARFVEAPVVAAAPVLRLVSVGKPIWSLSDSECRWPVSPDDADQHLFCASRITTAGPYCDHCRALAYAPESRPRVGYLKTRRFA